MKTQKITTISLMLFIGNLLMGQTMYYSSSRDFIEDGYTYRCEVLSSDLVNLYNKDNPYTHDKYQSSIRFTPTAEGRKLKFIKRGWMQKVSRWPLKVD